MCPEGTRFNQRTFVCDHAARVKCSEAANFFHRNVIVHEASVKAIPKPKNVVIGFVINHKFFRFKECVVKDILFKGIIYVNIPSFKKSMPNV